MANSSSVSELLQVQEPRPFLKWVGGKSQLLSELLVRTPKNFGHYFEPFFGGGAFFFRLSPNKSYLSDINPELINTYHVVRDQCEDLIESLGQHRYERNYFYRIREADRAANFSSWSEVERAARFIYLNKTCFNGLYRVNSKGQFNVPFGRYKNPKIFDSDQLRRCSRALQNVNIATQSFEAAIARVRRGDFVYFDPPYVPLSVSSSFTSYSKDKFDMTMQILLRDCCVALHKRGAFFLLSNSSAPAVYGLYRDFKIEEIGATRSINSVGNKRGKVKELLIRNYD